MFRSKNLIFIGVTCLLSTALSLESNGQLEAGDVKFDYKSATISYGALIRKLEKPEKIYTITNNTFKYNYPVEIDNARGGYYYRGKVYCSFAKSQTEAEISVITNFGGMQSSTMSGDEAINVTDPATYNTTKAYIRNYSVVYPVTISVYNNKGVLVKTIDFFTAAAPLNFRFTKELAEPAITTYNNPFATTQEIINYEKAGKANKAAEKYAYFEAMRKVDEVIKNYFGTFDYDFEIGVLNVRKKKSGPYADLNETAGVLEDAISALKKKNLPLKDSLAKVALEKFTQLSASTEERINPVAKEIINYNILVCHALLGNFDKAEECLAKHIGSKVQQYAAFSGNSMSYFISTNKIRTKLQSGETIHL